MEPTATELKAILKAAMIELFTERKEWFSEMIHEILEDYHLGKAMEEGLQNDLVSKKEVLQALRKTN